MRIYVKEFPEQNVETRVILRITNETRSAGRQTCNCFPDQPANIGILPQVGLHRPRSFAGSALVTIVQTLA
jgi:hypothetical protein